jgi:damage-control phosphatase, subfamily I
MRHDLLEMRQVRIHVHGFMKTYLDCIPCFFKQALFAARAATKDEKKAKEVLDRVARLIPTIPLSNSPPETARLIYSAVREVTGVADPFKAYKETSIQKALSLYGELKSMVKNSEDPLQAALRVAIAGNVIDLGANPDFDLEKEMKGVMHEGLSLDHYESFRESLEKARTVLYLGDNAGESVFDRILIEALGKNTIYAVRAIPIINDATVEDAEKSGINEVAQILSSGCDAPGTILKRCSPEFLAIFKEADLIISKGQGNFETLSGEEGPIFFLLKVKCPVIARHLDVSLGEMTLRGGRAGPSALRKSEGGISFEGL